MVRNEGLVRYAFYDVDHPEIIEPSVVRRRVRCFQDIYRQKPTEYFTSLLWAHHRHATSDGTGPITPDLLLDARAHYRHAVYGPTDSEEEKNP